ncbi:hypothetical protein CCHR01_03928 [Colletotrichum chrysophilum]|uniref:Uncharacterized protein n=1 Tax=Colletotrichum chrysophilum TaxID=1836956 RepID=A0AAD9AUB3_9PEZI|nr:hypothetical protein CCHR01_03928 [Colletotrichum chrysophilum]
MTISSKTPGLDSTSCPPDARMGRLLVLRLQPSIKLRQFSPTPCCRACPARVFPSAHSEHHGQPSSSYTIRYTRYPQPSAAIRFPYSNPYQATLRNDDIRRTHMNVCVLDAPWSTSDGLQSAMPLPCPNYRIALPATAWGLAV